MGGIKVSEKLEINKDHLDWLRQMAEEYGLFDVDKALRVVLDYAIQEGDQETIFTEVRCNHCGNTPNQD